MTLCKIIKHLLPNTSTEWCNKIQLCQNMLKYFLFYNTEISVPINYILMENHKF
jgi:hypothetical protein